MTNSLLLNMVIEIVDLPIQNAGCFHSLLYDYQRVYPINIPLNHYKSHQKSL